MATTEQICKRHATLGRRVYRAIKRRTSKRWRRAAKLRPEDAPVRRPIAGWCD